MNFNTKLNYYMELIDCTATELSNASSISTSVICRYRKGDRIPKYQSKQFESIVKGLYTIASKKNIPNLPYKKIYQDLELCLNNGNIQPDIFRKNFNFLINTLHINVSDLSRYIGFDSSYLSKIKSGSRTPSNLEHFSNAIIKYITENSQNTSSKKEIASLIGINEESLNKKEDYYQILKQWINSKDSKKEDTGIQSFLTKLDEFDLNDYIKSTNFNKIKLPTSPIQLPKSKFYYGIEGFKKSQLDLLKSIILSKSNDNVFFYSNMSMIEGSQDKEFTKKFIIGIALMLKKGIHLHIIHDLERPWKELMLGLEGWIPIYMTGQISPYYFKDNSNLLFQTIDCTSGTTCLSGRTISNHIDLGTFYVTNKKNEVELAKKKMKLLIKKALPLMNIYTEKRKKEFEEILIKQTNLTNKRKNIYYNLPIYTISYNLLEKILNRNNITPKDKSLIIKYVTKEKKRIKKILEQNIIIDEFDIANKTNWQDKIHFLSLSNIFYQKKIYYTYEEYKEHIKNLQTFEKKYSNYYYQNKSKTTFKRK